ncbi:ABC-type uncharacterized transport system, substrate-binding protein [Filomicrobium insigne]|uniref:ABC-type uncharacterized transport system, substrate-binding protein n=1 Tax=Filomicrobium insigne TaxID=418854 RepID=A0A1H0MDS7_9HYPH|nr:DUF1007 family protein [Filomicrobium insigne]SDO78544.1 ABC-type uncharacterized transport system, substrate-binding protein [Filomicrobium insigne]
MLLTLSRIIAAHLAVLALVISTPLAAHPHVWVSVETTLVYDNGRISGFQNSWTFDDAYTSMAIEGLDANGDGKYSRDELTELAQVNIDGLKEFDYFTYPKLNDEALALGAPRDYWLEHKDGILTLHFFLPLAEPVLAATPGFTFQVFDPTYFIAFDLAEKDPIKLAAGAPPECHIDIGVPKADTAEAEKLGEAFFQQFGGDIGIGLAKTVSVKCSSS